MMSKKELRAQLPNVGDVRMETQTTARAPGIPAEPMECVVIDVNPAHLWYRVRFTKSGFIECYKVPKLKPRSQGGILDD